MYISKRAIFDQLLLPVPCLPLPSHLVKVHAQESSTVELACKVNFGNFLILFIFRIFTKFAFSGTFLACKFCQTLIGWAVIARFLICPLSFATFVLVAFLYKLLFYGFHFPCYSLFPSFYANCILLQKLILLCRSFQLRNFSCLTVFLF